MSYEGIKGFGPSSVNFIIRYIVRETYSWFSGWIFPLNCRRIGYGLLEIVVLGLEKEMMIITMLVESSLIKLTLLSRVGTFERSEPGYKWSSRGKGRRIS